MRTLNLPELLSLVALLFLHLILLLRNLFLKKTDVITIIYLLQMLSWLHLILQHLLLIDLVVFASTVKNQAMTSLSASASKKITKGNNINLVIFFLVHKQPLLMILWSLSPNLRVSFIGICLNLPLPSRLPQVTNLGFSTQLAVIT